MMEWLIILRKNINEAAAVKRLYFYILKKLIHTEIKLHKYRYKHGAECVGQLVVRLISAKNK